MKRLQTKRETVIHVPTGVIHLRKAYGPQRMDRGATLCGLQVGRPRKADWARPGEAGRRTWRSCNGCIAIHVGECMAAALPRGPRRQTARVPP